ncbi:MAG: hypothetical protein AAFZ52_15030, partial [Bacteroidota bacterium]
MESIKTEDFKTLNILVYALMAGMTLFTCVVLFLVTGDQGIGDGPIFGEIQDLGFVALFAVVCVTMSRVLYQKLLDNLPREDRQDYNKAFSVYRSANILRYALLEGPGLMACVFALLTGNLQLLLVTAFLLAVMWMVRPSAEQFADWR